MTANKPMTGEQLDELMTIAVNMQRDSESNQNRPTALFAYAVQVAVLELRKVRDDAAALAAENTELNNFIAKSCYVQAGEEGAWYPAMDHSPETPATNQLSVEESRFLTDVITAAGLLSYGKQDKVLARRITDFCVSKRGNSNPAQLRQRGAA